MTERLPDQTFRGPLAICCIDCYQSLQWEVEINSTGLIIKQSAYRENIFPSAGGCSLPQSMTGYILSVLYAKKRGHRASWMMGEAR